MSQVVTFGERTFEVDLVDGMFSVVEEGKPGVNAFRVDPIPAADVGVYVPPELPEEPEPQLGPEPEEGRPA